LIKITFKAKPTTVMGD